jgi:GrpB-like predicted nucleotidyltransferase (UPF0157 family)
LTTFLVRHDLLQHVGSTAIPDVPAKPILDIQVGVDDLDEVQMVEVDPAGGRPPRLGQIVTTIEE